MPVGWHSHPSLSFALRHHTMEFFKKSSRFNAVIFVWDVMSLVGRGAAVAVVHIPITHPSARRPASLDFLFGERRLKGYSLRKEIQRPSSQFTAELEAGELPNANPASFLRWARSELEMQRQS